MARSPEEDAPRGGGRERRLDPCRIREVRTRARTDTSAPERKAGDGREDAVASMRRGRGGAEIRAVRKPGGVATSAASARSAAVMERVVKEYGETPRRLADR